MSNKLKNFIKTLGPGILFASTAIGVSHLVQSTRAGANFGFALIPIILAVNLFKYPFFEFGSRYANATGESIIDGYKRIGKWMLWLYFLITLGSMFFVCAAVGAVTSGFLQNLFGVADWGIWFTVALFVISGGILFLGKYGFLDSLIKIIGSVLLISTLSAFILALIKGPNPGFEAFEGPNLWDNSSMLFIIALMGWMPTAVDLSAWTSLWTIERIKQTGYKPTLKETLMDFNFGYIISALLAICFVTMGAYMLYGSGEALPDGSGAFAHSIIGLFTGFIGEWSYIIIAIAAFSIMFGTCIAVFDGYSRSIERTIDLLFFREDFTETPIVDHGYMESDFVEISVTELEKQKATTTNIYKIALGIVLLGAFGIVYFFGKHLKALVDLATTISFLIAPVIAIVNFRLVTSSFVKQEAHPKMWLKALSILGIIFLTGFALYFIWVKFITS
ncbi:MAG: divalent metal cation transporter [Crocinitomicaceae bacterium]|nr:divalent metal cation transporter [Crocinitomicaceae bacterium]